ncbi:MULTISPECIES: RNA polymerase sigma factor [Neomoorella]|uniref:RNA polymerase sigma factor n=1 Tax=Neomoorella thermoacetica TaxID=1525 RepID=A0A1J5JLP7_NEOTH|nr:MULTISPECIES: sigma-70 family RNA polymerase sigma factor [Moorella]OIQ07643.1 ECF RNA polymerase sigma factor SigW [Moorella thermoacetica]OIQ10407.1 ECF RNA polymerase sigma factor SigW [Moorella thermoacetica]BCV22537.1 RNA polymerase subunit sigma-24 [Moorella sp. Hama-1]
MDRSDAELIALSQQGDEGAFAELVARYQKKVYTVALRLLQDREESLDVAQEVFLRAYRALPGFQPGAALAPWLLAIAANASRDHWRQRRRERGGPAATPVDEETLLAVADSRAGPAKLWEEAETRRMVKEAVAALPWDYRVPIVLWHFQDLSYEEIARTLALPLNTVKTRIRRGRLLLKKMLAPVLEEGGLQDG